MEFEYKEKTESSGKKDDESKWIELSDTKVEEVDKKPHVTGKNPGETLEMERNIQRINRSERGQRKRRVRIVDGREKGGKRRRWTG